MNALVHPFAAAFLRLMADLRESIGSHCTGFAICAGLILLSLLLLRLAMRRPPPQAKVAASSPGQAAPAGALNPTRTEVSP